MGGIDPEPVGAAGVGTADVALVEDAVGRLVPGLEVGRKLDVGGGKIVCNFNRRIRLRL